jgi:carbonic anhydrase
MKWGYEGDKSPKHWGNLSREFKVCKTGTKQSPVNINISKTEKTEKNSFLKFNYRSSIINLINNGNSIQQNYDEGSSINVSGEDYQLVEFHFHSPSEHTVNGKFYEMELHLVHKNDVDQYAVIGIFIETGEENSFFKKFWDNMPKEEGWKYQSNSEKINAEKLLPKNKSFYMYDGSFTRPPCTEGVKWFVFSNPIQISNDQLAKFKKLYDRNIRPTFPLNKRIIKYYTT